MLASWRETLFLTQKYGSVLYCQWMNRTASRFPLTPPSQPADTAIRDSAGLSALAEGLPSHVEITWEHFDFIFDFIFDFVFGFE
jgi:hypothetical protein